jgi:hypothetical protein
MRTFENPLSHIALHKEWFIKILKIISLIFIKFKKQDLLGMALLYMNPKKKLTKLYAKELESMIFMQQWWVMIRRQ